MHKEERGLTQGNYNKKTGFIDDMGIKGPPGKPFEFSPDENAQMKTGFEAKVISPEPTGSDSFEFEIDLNTPCEEIEISIDQIFSQDCQTHQFD